MSHRTLSELHTAIAPARAKKTVLIVDDDTVFCSSLSDGLQLMLDDVTVYMAENGEQAVAIVRSTAVDLVITDLRMHKMDGRELVLWMDELRPGLPVIVMSAYADPSTIVDLGMQGIHFFDKPLDLHNLALTVRSLLS